MLEPKGRGFAFLVRPNDFIPLPVDDGDFQTPAKAPHEDLRIIGEFPDS